MGFYHVCAAVGGQFGSWRGWGHRATRRRYRWLREGSVRSGKELGNGWSRKGAGLWRAAMGLLGWLCNIGRSWLRKREGAVTVVGGRTLGLRVCWGKQQQGRKDRRSHWQGKGKLVSRGKVLAPREGGDNSGLWGRRLSGCFERDRFRVFFLSIYRRKKIIFFFFFPIA